MLWCEDYMYFNEIVVCSCMFWRITVELFCTYIFKALFSILVVLCYYPLLSTF